MFVKGQENADDINGASWVATVVAPIGQRVTFTSLYDEIPLPDPLYLSLHAACAQVAHASGMAEYLDDIFRDFEELRVLPEDGCSDVLMVVLNCVSVC